MTGRRRIVLIGPAHPFRGGIAQHTTLLFRALAEEADVTLLSYSRLYPGIFFPGTTQYDDSKTTITVANRRMINPLNPVSWLKAFLKSKDDAPDLVIIQWWQPYFGPCLGTISRLVKRFVGARIVFICHNVLPHEQHWWDPMLSRYALSTADRILVHGNRLRRQVRLLLPSGDCFSHPHPVYDQFGMTGCTKEQAKSILGVHGNIVLFFGLVRPYKGLDLLLKALPAVLKKADVHLIVAGEFYEPKARYLDLIRALDLEAHVTVIDRYIPNEEVERYFAACDLVVCPYTSGSQSGVAQIAYAFEKPVVCTDVGSLPDAVIEGKTGYVAASGDPDDLARCILRYYGADQDFAVHIRDYKTRFDWRSLASALLDDPV